MYVRLFTLLRGTMGYRVSKGETKGNIHVIIAESIIILYIIGSHQSYASANFFISTGILYIICIRGCENEKDNKRYRLLLSVEL